MLNEQATQFLTGMDTARLQQIPVTISGAGIFLDKTNYIIR